MPGVDYCCKYFKIIVIISKVLEIDVRYIWLFFILFWLFLVLFCNEEKMVSVKMILQLLNITVPSATYVTKNQTVHFFGIFVKRTYSISIKLFLFMRDQLRRKILVLINLENIRNWCLPFYCCFCGSIAKNKTCQI